MRGYVAPMLDRKTFTCPHCGVYAQQYWSILTTTNHHVTDVRQSQCLACANPAIWYNERMVYPLVGTAPLANPDLPDGIKADYLEARAIARTSPRGAAALLRLTIDKLTSHLGAQGDKLDKRIGDLVSKGLDPMVQQMLDSVRVIGNNAVHPGQIDPRDDPELTQALFWLVNEIADDLITKRNRLDSIFGQLPQGSRDQIAKRDQKALAGSTNGSG